MPLYEILPLCETLRTTANESWLRTGKVGFFHKDDHLPISGSSTQPCARDVGLFESGQSDAETVARLPRAACDGELPAHGRKLDPLGDRAEISGGPPFVECRAKALDLFLCFSQRSVGTALDMDEPVVAEEGAQL